MTEDMQNLSSYKTLESIQDRKLQLRKEIRRDNDQINKLSKQLFTKPAPLMTKRGKLNVNGLMATGAGVFDSILLIWKLYKKFKLKR